MLDDPYWLMRDDHSVYSVSFEEYLAFREELGSHEAWERYRRVAETSLGAAWVSTVFLTMNHSFGDGPPVLFETMVFDGVLDGEQDRYYTWDEAAAGHEAMVARVRAAEALHAEVDEVARDATRRLP